MKTFIAAATLALAFVVIPGSAQAQQIPGPQNGERAPAILAKGLDGRPISLDDFRGKVLVLNFWATWCGPCRLETPDMIRSYAQLRGSDVAFLGVDSTEKAPIIHSFISAKGLPYPVAIDDDHATSVAYDVLGIPTTYVIDGTGVVRARFVDVISVGQLAAFVSAAKAGKNGTITSPVQAKIDATLDPAQFTYPSDYEGILRTVKASTEAINTSNKLLGDADPAKGEVTDYLKIRAGQAALESTAIASLTPVVKSDADRALLFRLQGDYATNIENWPGAIAAYQKALGINGKDQDALSGLAFAYYEKKDWKSEIAAYEQLAALAPDPDTDISIGKAYLQLKDYPNAIAAERKGVTLAERNFADKKDSGTTLYGSYTWLYLGRAYVEAGDSANAHKAFVNAMRYA
ncbi:MAG: redoxin domain-containing protein, partial [Candidatus Eremiobacteraeota bacterium]|nr:redoxin domain-containing protein [Candidatus Eremiobacteraeota bacterium]